MRASVRPIAVAGCLALMAACASTVDTTTKRSPAGPSTTTAAASAVVTHEATYVDHSRSTPAFPGVFPGAPSRTLRVLFFTPARDAATVASPMPVILFSHGLTATPEDYTPLLTDVARRGYFVVAPAFPLTNAEAPRGNTAGDLVHQPGDVSFVLDQVIAQSRRPGWMQGLVDPKRIATGGHSLGGITTYGVAFNACCRDRRITAAFVIDGLAAGFPDAKYFTGIHTPLLVIHGGKDASVAVELGRNAFDRANTPKYFMTIVSGRHSSEAHGGHSPGQRALTSALLGFLDRYLRGEARGLVQLRRAAEKPGLTTLDAQR
jgi:predicted dienelactone hydrolase